MAKTTNQQTTTIATSSKRYPLTAAIRRKLQVMFLDNENVFKTCMYPDFNSQPEQRDLTMQHYNERRHELDMIAKGLTPLLGHDYANDKSGTDEVVYALFYGYSWNMRAIKRLLFDSFQMEGLSQGKVTAECGVFQFRVNDITKQEAMKLFMANRYDAETNPDGLLTSVYVPDNLPTGSRAFSGGQKQRVKPLATVRKMGVSTTPQAEKVFSSEPTTRRATSDELAILKQSKVDHPDSAGLIVPTGDPKHPYTTKDIDERIAELEEQSIPDDLIEGIDELTEM